MNQVSPAELSVRPFHLLDKEWAILVGGNEQPNPMTVSWGGLGTLWNRPVVTIYVRPTRHTYQLLEGHNEFSLNFLPPDARRALEVCGNTSGRDGDKWQASGLKPELAARIKVPRVAGARLAFECRVLAHVDLDPARFIDSSINKLYPMSDYHRMYFGEVVYICES
jgi:flavin reductase (DIM6/NTAB) family NADH-FMN oxidoreductase RutF